MIKNKLRPCDVSIWALPSLLQTQGTSINDDGIMVEHGYVLITVGHATMRISHHLFKNMAEWYLEEQETLRPYHIQDGTDSTTHI